jgi:hypothetical protein
MTWHIAKLFERHELFELFERGNTNADKVP